jgi:hypothetical protein
MPTAAELIAQLNALEGDEAAEAQRLFTNDQGPVIKAARGKIAGPAKREGGAQVAQLKQELTAAQDRIAELEGETEGLKSSQPDYAKREAELKEKYEKKVADAEARAKAKEDALRAKDREGVAAMVEAQLKEVHRLKSRAALWGRREIMDRIDVSGEAPRILKPGESTPYDAESLQDAVALAAADYAKGADPDDILTNVDHGGGRGSGGNGAQAGKTVKDIAATKQASGAYAL